jgi:hypothetical protein
LTGEHVQADVIDRQTGKKRKPRLMMPPSRNGRGKKKARSISVPVTPELADRLKGRSGVLLKQANGTTWAEINLPHYFAGVMKDVKFNNVSKVTMYSLRHTSIVRTLICRTPIGVVAATHDTSTMMIERIYSKHITDVSDELVRGSRYRCSTPNPRYR